MKIGRKFSARALVIYFLIGIGIIGIVTFIYSNYLIQKIKKETETTSRLFAEFARGTSVDEEKERLLELFYEEVIKKIDFPVILTDVDGIYDSSGKVISRLNIDEANEMLKLGTASGGMFPKIEASIKALSAAPIARIINGKIPHALLEESENKLKGTTIVPK